MGQLHARERGEGKKLAQVARSVVEDAHARHTAQQQQQQQPGGGDAEPDLSTPMGGMLARLAAVGAFDAEPGDGSGRGDGGGDAGPAIVYLWPECVPAWGHWRRLQTQWRNGMGGREGLDYGGVQAYLDEHMPPRGRRRRELFACIQACELACLEFWDEVRQRHPPTPPSPPANR